ncbi:MAG: hypothetical protein OXD54_18110 [Candidatus Poribacteria bacterium]|nr:hypothetical protein [Candidatus Poribacteria bacterium]
MLTFFQHFLIGKMEEETHNDEEGVDPEQPESEHQDPTSNSDSLKNVEEIEDDETPNEGQPENENESDSSSKTVDPEVVSQPEQTPQSDDTEEVNASETDETPESEERETVEEDITPDSNISSEEQAPSESKDIPEEEATEVAVQSDTQDQSETEPPSESQDTPPEPEVSEAEPLPDTVDTHETDHPSDTDDTPEETDDTPEEEETNVEKIPSSDEEIKPYSLGENEELYDFITNFKESVCSGGEHISVNIMDSSGGVTKPALFEHPSPTEPSRIAYQLDLPSVDDNDTLFLYFSIGLRDGVVFDDPDRQPGGVKYSIEISGEQCFESVSTECHWIQHGLNLTRYAGEKVELVFITQCNVEGNSSYAWALWGQPKLLKLTRNDVIVTDEKLPPIDIQCGIAIAQVAENHNVLFDFNRDGFTPATEIANEIYSQLDTSPIDLTLFASQPKLEIVSVGTTAAVIGMGEAFEVQCTIKNVGAGPLSKDSKTRLSISDIKLRRGRTAHNVKTLGPGDTLTYVWYARGVSRPSDINYAVTLKSRYLQGEGKMKGSVNIRPALPKLDTKVIPELYTFMEGKHLVFGNKHLRMIFVHNNSPSQENVSKSKSKSFDKSPQGYEYYAIYVAKGSNYQQVATSKVIAEVTYLSKDTVHTIKFVPNDVQLAGDSLGQSILRISGENKDSDGVTWSLQLELILTEDSKRIKTAYKLSVDKKRELLAFRGTEIYAGHKSTREKKTAALFPGLEYLEGDEPSSNTRDAAPPHNNRLVPHPYKITIPVMAVEIQKSIVGIAWNPLQCWDGQMQNVSAVFSSPNMHNQERNHLMGLFLPTVPDLVKENNLIAETAYQLKSGKEITLDCEIIADGNASILAAISHWTSAFGTPKPLTRPRNDEEEVLLSRHGFMHTVWDAEERQSRHCVDWASRNEPGFATLLWYDYLATKSEEVKSRVMEIAEKTIADDGAEGLAYRGSCHILGGELPFYYGHLDAALGLYETEVQPIIESQSDDGSWGFQPTSEKTQNLGTAGDVVLGTCALNALKLLKHARITGDKKSLNAGKKALSYMDRFVVPRGAQPWECPIYEPDILAAAHAIGAYVEAHEVSGNKTYLKRAEYWAETGLPFLYHWHLPDRPGMQFASIPVFGTTFYTHPWFGVPVQWNGLVYAYYLQRLNEYSRDERWRQVAEGITVSALYQQWDDGELKGTYPDGFYGFCTEGKGPHINPEDIMVNVYTLSGLDPGVKSAIAGSIHLSSGAIPVDFTASRSGELKWGLNYAENETSHTLITGYGQVPSLIRVQGEQMDDDKDNSTIDIPQVESLEEVTSGWRYIPEKDAILIKQIHITNEMQYQLTK